MNINFPRPTNNFKMAYVFSSSIRSQSLAQKVPKSRFRKQQAFQITFFSFERYCKPLMSRQTNEKGFPNFWQSFAVLIADEPLHLFIPQKQGLSPPLIEDFKRIQSKLRLVVSLHPNPSFFTAPLQVAPKSPQLSKILRRQESAHFVCNTFRFLLHCPRSHNIRGSECRPQSCTFSSASASVFSPCQTHTNWGRFHTIAAVQCHQNLFPAQKRFCTQLTEMS